MFICMKIQIFNKLPEEALGVGIRKFKSVLFGKWLKEKVFYLVKDYLTSEVLSICF